MLVKENSFPYIIAYGVSKEQIGQFYVEIEKHLFSVGLSNKIAHCRYNKLLIINCITISFADAIRLDVSTSFRLLLQSSQDFQFEVWASHRKRNGIFTIWYLQAGGRPKKPTQQMKELIHTLKIEIDNEANNSITQRFHSNLSLDE